MIQKPEAGDLDLELDWDWETSTRSEKCCGLTRSCDLGLKRAGARIKAKGLFKNCGTIVLYNNYIINIPYILYLPYTY